MDVEGRNTSREIRQEGIVTIQARDKGSFEQGGNYKERRFFFLSKQLKR